MKFKILKWNICCSTCYCKVKDVVLEFTDAAESIQKCKDLFENKDLVNQLSFIKAHFSFLIFKIKILETEQMLLTSAVSVINSCDTVLKKVPN